MSDIKKIELALSDLTTALAEHAEKHAADIGSERIESWHNLFKNIAQRVEKLEAAALSESDLGRITELEKRIDDLENDGLDNVRTIIADMINDGDIRLHID